MPHCDNPYSFGAIDNVAIHGVTTFGIIIRPGTRIEYYPFANHASAGQWFLHHEMHLPLGRAQRPALPSKAILVTTALRKTASKVVWREPLSYPSYSVSWGSFPISAPSV